MHTNIKKDENKIDEKIFYHSLVFPVLFLVAIWLVKITETVLEVRFSEWGVFPRKLIGLRGIIFSPFLHGDWNHLLANSPTFLVLSFFIFYFYRKLAYKVMLWMFFLSGFWLWLGGREAYHIGASGLIYGMAAFLFLSGVLRKYTRLMAISLIVVFLYGGMIWGVFPIWTELSWEGHLFGAISGFLLAMVFRKQGPQRPLYSWEIDDETDDTDHESNYTTNTTIQSRSPFQ